MQYKDLMSKRFRGYLPVVVDIETAGFDPVTDAILEVAMMTVKFDENLSLVPDELFHANIRPFEGSCIKSENIDFLGIDPFDESRELKSEREAVVPMFKSIAKKIKEHGCKKAILVGHNGSFDLSFLKELALRENYKRFPFHPFSIIDTASLSALLYGQTVLLKACNSANIDFHVTEAHSSIYDTTKECELFCKIYNRFTTFCGLPEMNDE